MFIREREFVWKIRFIVTQFLGSYGVRQRVLLILLVGIILLRQFDVLCLLLSDFVMQIRKLSIDQGIIFFGFCLRFRKFFDVEVFFLGDILIALIKVQLKYCSEVNQV